MCIIALTQLLVKWISIFLVDLYIQFLIFYIIVDFIFPFFIRKGFCEVPKKFPMLWKPRFSSGFSRDSRFSRKSLKRRKTLGKSGKLWKIQEKEQKSHLYKNFNFGAFLGGFRAIFPRFRTLLCYPENSDFCAFKP